MPKRARYTIGTSGVSARNHAICDGPHVVAEVLGAGYPAGKGWHTRTEALTAEIVAKLNAPDYLAFLRELVPLLMIAQEYSGSAQVVLLRVTAAIATAENNDA